jgi:hypothetical protein
VLEQQALSLARLQVIIVLEAAEQYRLVPARARTARAQSRRGLRDDPWGNAVRIVVTESGDVDVR